MNLNKLKAIYKTETGKHIFDFLAAYKRQTKETSVNDLKDYIVNYHLKVEETLEAMAAAGTGRFIVGRRGGVTRMEWGVSILDLVQQVQDALKTEETVVTGGQKPSTKALEDILKMTSEINARVERLEKLAAVETQAQV